MRAIEIFRMKDSQPIFLARMLENGQYMGNARWKVYMQSKVDDLEYLSARMNNGYTLSRILEIEPEPETDELAIQKAVHIIREPLTD